MLPTLRTGRHLVRLHPQQASHKLLRQALSAIIRPRTPPARIVSQRPPHLAKFTLRPCFPQRPTLTSSFILSSHAPHRLSSAPASTWAQLQYPSTTAILQSQYFHSTSKTDGIPPFLVLLKSSYTLGAIQFIGRFTMSLIPFLFIKGRFSAILMNNINLEENPQLAGQYTQYANRIQQLHKATWVLLVAPFVFLGLTFLASSERTPLTGRWRVILLSPAEEEAIAEDLQGTRWFEAVSEIMAESNGGVAPSIIPQDDWRWNWVESTLRRLEQAVMVLHDDEQYQKAYLDHITSKKDQDGLPLLPPPPSYPLLPRPRAASLLHEMPLTTDEDHTVSSELSHNQTHHVPPHTLLGPPYSLLIVQKDESNAFSYGFGPKGGGGVVVYSGFLDDILATSSGDPPQNVAQASTQSSQSLWSNIAKSLGLSSSAPASPSRQPFLPSSEQTSQLAILLAHELSHLILSHHIETLSSGTILLPVVVSICVDTVRTILYPLTFLFGPFVADALDSSLRIGVDEMARAGESCTSRRLEVEADVVSTRLLALAGFDPREAVSFWEERMKASSGATEPTPAGSGRVSPGSFWKNSPAHSSHPEGDKRITHPVSEERVSRLKEELEEWRARSLKVWEKVQKQRPPDESIRGLSV